MDDVKITFDLSNFRNTLRDYISRRAPEKRARALNTKAYKLAWLALKYTKKGSRQKIEELFGVARKIVRSRKTGKTKAGRVVVGEETRARAIYAAREKKAGRPLEGDIDAKARRMVTSRLSGVGSIRAGWIPAIKKLFAVSDEKLSQPGEVLRRDGEQKGYAIRAEKEKPVAEIANSMPALKVASVTGLAEAGLARAFQEVQADMEQYLLNKEMEAAREAGIEAHG